MKNSSGEFSTLNYPSRGHPFSVCLWKIVLPKDKYISLTFPEFSISRDPDTGECIDLVELVLDPSDKLSLTDGVRLGHVLCGQAPPLILLNTSLVVITYKTGLDAESLGFRAQYESRSM